MDTAVSFVDTPVISSNLHDTGTDVTSPNGMNGTTSLTILDFEELGFMSDGMRIIFEVINFVILTGLISFCGMIANIINIIVFFRQGLTDSIGLSLLGLAISDFGASTTHVWMSTCINPLFAQSGIPFNSPTVQYITAGWPHVCFARITSFITAYITFERCLCIVIPLKVKNIITPRRTLFVIIAIYFMIAASVSPVYYAIRLGWVLNEEQNRTVIDLVYSRHGVYIENVSLLFNACSQLTSFVLVIICSLFLVNGLQEKSKWRQNSTTGDANASSRDNRVVKMVLIVASVFIVCYLPSATNLIIMTTSEEYSIVGRYKNMFQTAWSFLNVLEATNSAVNIFIYYKMSTKYRKEFRRLFCFAPDDDK